MSLTAKTAKRARTRRRVSWVDCMLSWRCKTMLDGSIDRAPGIYTSITVFPPTRLRPRVFLQKIIWMSKLGCLSIEISWVGEKGVANINWSFFSPTETGYYFSGKRPDFSTGKWIEEQYAQCMRFHTRLCTFRQRLKGERKFRANTRERGAKNR